jgi:hypothetical protein
LTGIRIAARETNKGSHEYLQIVPLLREAVVGSQPDSQRLDEVVGRQPFIGKCTSNEFGYNETAEAFRSYLLIEIVGHEAGVRL